MSTNYTQLTKEQIENFLNAKCKIEMWEEETNRKWFADVLIKLLEEQEDFNGKRPFGDSGWFSDLETSLIEACEIGTVAYDEYGYVEESEVNNGYDVDDCFRQIVNHLILNT